MIDRLKELFYKITGKAPLNVNHFAGTWEAVRETTEAKACVFVLCDITWTVYYDGKEIEYPPGIYTRTSDTSADIYYSADFYRGGCFAAIATFILRNNNNTLVWEWGSGVEMEFRRVT